MQIGLPTPTKKKKKKKKKIPVIADLRKWLDTPSWKEIWLQQFIKTMDGILKSIQDGNPLWSKAEDVGCS